MGHFARTFDRIIHMFGMLIVVDSSSCYLETSECTLASASAKRQICLFECAVHTLCSASDVPFPIAFLIHHPNQCEHNAASTRRGDSEFDVNAIGCRQHEVKGQ